MLFLFKMIHTYYGIERNISMNYWNKKGARFQGNLGFIAVLCKVGIQTPVSTIKNSSNILFGMRLWAGRRSPPLPAVSRCDLFAKRSVFGFSGELKAQGHAWLHSSQLRGRWVENILVSLVELALCGCLFCEFPEILCWNEVRLPTYSSTCLIFFKLYHFPAATPSTCTMVNTQK